MWRSSVPGSSSSSSAVAPASAVLARNGDDDDDWETDPDYVNDMSEEQQRWGGARDTGTIE